jgi:HlyD family secretion protein
MISNARGWVWVAVLLGELGGCERVKPAGPAPLQGVIEYEERTIGVDVGGRVMAVDVERGQRVEAGGSVVRLDDGLERPLRDLRSAELSAAEAQLRLLKAGARGEELRAAEADIASLRSQEDIVRKNLARAELLVKQSAAPQSVVDDMLAQLQSTSERRRGLEERLKALRSGARGDEISAAVARVQAATAALAAQDARLARYTLVNPAAGSVIDVHVKAGEMVSPGAPAFTVADLGHPYVDVFVPQARMHEVRVGMDVALRVDGVTQALPASVEHIFPSTEFTPRFLFSEAERPNLVLRVRVRVRDDAQVLHAGVPAFVTIERVSGGAS